MTAVSTEPLVQLQRPTIATDASRRTATRTVTLTIDGQSVTVREGTTILAACREIGVEIPTLCFLDTLHPVNVCRICVVE
ncbi:MAG TPA: 2Fe-2S iron-sulfur cluster-binding protein, partial [Gemmatimonadaceae bacterium]|nr:2Fe-2S iron-sulfur cluster-binding protein [Gemmatimonadaceae bacterium]